MLCIWNCPAFDLVFSIFNGKSYYPALVNIKCWDAIGHRDMNAALDDMRTYLKEYRDEDKVGVKALCILLVIGSQSVGKLPEAMGKFPEDNGAKVSRSS